MIIVYPMLTSPGVSSNLLPGIIKAVEKYILVYHTDEIMRYGSRTVAGRILTTGIATIAGAAVAAGAAKYGPTLATGAGAAISKIMSGEDQTQNPGSSILESGIKVSQKVDASGDVTRTTDTSMDVTSRAPARIDLPKSDAVSLEPTWISVTTEKKGTQLLGVKVVPFRIKSSENITKLMLNDAELKKLDLLQAKYGRAITRVLYRLIKKIPLLKGGGITEDPKKDIIYGATSYKKNIFLCLSQMDIEASDFLTHPTAVRKLQQLGWASMIIADDVNRRATFCMKEFGGICSIVPYNFMFASLGRDINKAYEDLEDVRKASGPFFNMKTNRKRVFSEGAMTVTDKYLDLLNKG